MKLYRTLCAPGTYVAKKLAAHHPGIRQLIINMAQRQHQRVKKFEMRVNDYTSGTKSTCEIQPLQEEKALQIGADTVGEGGVYMMALAGTGVFMLGANRLELYRQKKFACDMEDLERKIKLLQLLSVDEPIYAGKNKREGE